MKFVLLVILLAGLFAEGCVAGLAGVMTLGTAQNSDCLTLCRARLDPGQDDECFQRCFSN